MAANYLHGVETNRITKGIRVINEVKSAVIALIGTAPVGPVKTMTLSLSDIDAAAFGPDLPGFTLPDSLDTIAKYGVGTVLVYNVLDPAVHKTAVANEVVALSAGKATLAHPVVASLVLKSADGATTYVAGTDYTVTALTGEVLRVATGAIPANAASLRASYDYADPSKVTAADIIGGVDAGGVRTGLQAYKDTYNQFGLFAKIIIAPGFSPLNSVSAEMRAMADILDAVTYIDAPIGTTFAQALAGRGPNGTINFNTSSGRARLCYPHVKVYDATTDSDVLSPLSVHAAALRAKVDLEKGYWWSSSNWELQGVTGVERQLTAMINDPQSEVNLLNEVGITTVYNSFGTGARLWGNRTAAWPTVTHMSNFENVLRTGDMIDEAIRHASLQFMDMPGDDGVIDAILQSVDAFGRKKIGDGALVGFKVWFDPARNPEQERANGHVLIQYKFTPPPPLERLTYESEITSEYLITLKKAA